MYGSCATACGGPKRAGSDTALLAVKESDPWGEASTRLPARTSQTAPRMPAMQARIGLAGFSPVRHTPPPQCWHVVREARFTYVRSRLRRGIHHSSAERHTPEHIHRCPFLSVPNRPSKNRGTWQQVSLVAGFLAGRHFVGANDLHYGYWIDGLEPIIRNLPPPRRSTAGFYWSISPPTPDEFWTSAAGREAWRRN